MEVHANQKVEALINWLHVTQPTLTVVFCHTKATTAETAARLNREGFKAAYLSGDLAQAARNATLETFRRREIPVLVATDVAARGIDVRGISHVVNLDMPRGSENYVHRAGRTGRAGHAGTVVSLVTPHDRSKVRNLEREGSITFERLELPTAQQVAEVSRRRLFQDLAVRIDADEQGEYRELARELVANLDVEGLVASLLEDWHAATGKLSGGYEVTSPSATRGRRTERDGSDRFERGPRKERPRFEGGTARGRDGQDDREPRRPGSTREVEPGMSRIRLDIGKYDIKGPGHLVRVICDEAGVQGAAVGAIALQPKQCWIDVKSEYAGKVVDALNRHVDEKGKTWSARKS
jgi:ATP-dependent RNA helicase DeaD